MGTVDEETTSLQESDATRARSKQIELLSKDVLKEYDDLYKKCEEINTENEQLRKQLQDKDKTLQDAKNLIEPAINQYQKLKNKYKIEKGCRYEAQTYATKMVQKNMKLKRQSMDLLAVLERQPVAISELKMFDEEEEEELEGGTVDDQYQNVLNKEIKEFKNEIAELKVRLEQYQGDLQIEKENSRWAEQRCENLKIQLSQTETVLEQYKTQLKEYAEGVDEEYSSLKDRYEEEVRRRSFMEKKLEEYTVMNSKMKRQSDVLMMKVTPGEQLHKAMIEIEDLTQKLEEQRQYYDAQIVELEQQLGACNQEAVVTLETENEGVAKERDDLMKKLDDYDQKYSTLENQYKELQEKYERLRCPPPPPPPPPPGPIQKSGGFLSRITKKRKKEDQGSKLLQTGVAANSDFNKALEEMMSNIKRGRTLKPVKPIKTTTDNEGNAEFRMVLKSRSFDNGDPRKIPEDSNDNPMSELQKTLNKMKRVERDETKPAPAPTQQIDSELARTFQRIKKQNTVEAPAPLRSAKLSQVSEERESEIVNETQEEMFVHL